MKRTLIAAVTILLLTSQVLAGASAESNLSPPHNGSIEGHTYTENITHKQTLNTIRNYRYKRLTRQLSNVETHIAHFQQYKSLTPTKNAH